MKTFSAIVASLLLAGTTSVFASQQQQPAGGQSFSELDQQNQGYLDKSTAEEAGISEDQFMEMDSDGDGRVTEQEFNEYQQQSQ